MTTMINVDDDDGDGGSGGGGAGRLSKFSEAFDVLFINTQTHTTDLANSIKLSL